MKRFAVVGSGPVGQALATGLAKHGYEVLIGSRDPGKLAEFSRKTGILTGTLEEVLWTYPKDSPDSPTPVCLGNRVYMMRDNGVASCLDLNSGKVISILGLSTFGMHLSGPIYPFLARIVS